MCFRNEIDDQLCGVGLSVRFNSHLITIWHRDASKQASIDGMLACVMEELPPELRPRGDNFFYKKHSDHAGFKVPPELQGVVDAQTRAAASGNGQASESPADASNGSNPQVSVQSPQ